MSLSPTLKDFDSLPAASPTLDEYATQGIKKNRNVKFRIDFLGQELYELLVLLDERAIESASITTVRQCVRLADRIMLQARAQHF